MMTHTLPRVARLARVGGLAVIAAMAAMLGAPVARAEGIEVLFTTIPIPANAKEDAVPMIEATVIGGPQLDADKFILFDKNAKVPVELKGVSKRKYNEGNEKLAIAIVMNGWEMWIGNDKETGLSDGDPTFRQGVLIPLRAALDTLNFKGAGPPGSVGTVITYGDKATVKVPWGPLGELNGSKLGSQKDYFGTTGVELVKALELAMGEFRKVNVARKVLIVIGDGTDTNPDAARTTLQQLKKQCQSEQIQTFAIVYKAGGLSQENTIINLMIPSVSTVTSAETIASSVQNILTRMDDRQYVMFKSHDRTRNLGLVWDGKPHDLAIKIEKEETEPVSVVLAPVWDPSPSGFPWLMVILISVGALLLLIIGVAVFSKKPAEVPAPAPLPAPVVAEAAPPKPAGPMKTVMIGQGGEEGGFPVVGWMVPLNGQAAYQTFRLRSSGTKIGTAPPADIVVNDGFMSTDHCMIQCTPQGFILVDGGSTNGCYVNDKRISGKHELVDNDMVTLGKTNFKFKSIV